MVVKFIIKATSCISAAAVAAEVPGNPALLLEEWGIPVCFTGMASRKGEGVPGFSLPF
jgi:hypothetical protein